MLVHEVIDEQWAKEMPDRLPAGQAAGVRHLVLSHLVGQTSDSTFEKAQEGFDGKLTVGNDLDVIAL